MKDLTLRRIGPNRVQYLCPRCGKEFRIMTRGEAKKHRPQHED